MASTPPKRNYGVRAGQKKKLRPKFGDNSGPQVQLGGAYTSGQSRNDPNAYVPVPDSVGATQRPRRYKGGSKLNIDNKHEPGDTFLSYKTGSGEKPARKPKRRIKKTKSGDAYLG